MTPAEAKQCIADKITSLQDVISKTPPCNGLDGGMFCEVIRIETAMEDHDLLHWLAVQPERPCLYFSGRDGNDGETAGVGSADTVLLQDSLDYGSAFAYMNARLSTACPNLRYYGGMAFAPGHTDKDWQPFGAIRFWVPRFELSKRNGVTTLACNMVVEKEKKDGFAGVLRELEELRFEGYGDFKGPGKVTARTDVPDYEGWIANVTRVVAEIRAGKYQKTVLARKVLLQFEHKPDPVSILSFLKKLPSKRYDFLFQVDETHAFVGSSPERLYKREGRLIRSEALAGTRRRGDKELDDQLLAKELMDSGKEQMEHDFVLDMVEKGLCPLCSRLDSGSDKRLLKLKEGQHLVSYLEGRLKKDTTDEMLLKALHPTPAVGGVPLREALTAISESEGFKRGWYAGVVGTVGCDTCDFAVGLRSGRMDEHGLSLYSGVGVVEGSDPDEEWLEVNDKITNFMEIVDDENK